jgi:hypothetical protein
VAQGMRRENTYAKTMLGKILIVADSARRRSISMAYVRYGGCVIELLLLVKWCEEPECSELQKGCFWGSLEFNSYLARSIVLCMYVDCTKCL